MLPPLLILGASVRAAAFSARRAGFSVIAADMFADADLTAVAQATRVAAYPAGLLDAASQAAPAPWMYTGGLENHPQLIERIARHRTLDGNPLDGNPLYGNPSPVLLRVRCPFTLATTLRSEAIRCPPVSRTDDVPRDGSWLRKPRKSCGGNHIEPLTDGRQAPCQTSGWYYQRRIEGVPCGAVFVAHRDRATLLGITGQLTGTAWTGARAFAYAGSWGPLVVCAEVRDQWQHIGDCLSRRFQLRGLFGVDAVVAGSEVWVVEVNPRYTASIEVLERACGFAAIQHHVSACREDGPPPKLADDGTSYCGKAILYADGELTVTQPLSASLCRQNLERAHPVVADIPVAGTRIPTGHPIATVFAESTAPDELVPALQERLRTLRRGLAG